MVYYHTSGNVKMLRNIINDYNNAGEIAPHEYMKTYIEQCPENIEDAKVSWIAETFLSFHKNRDFMREIASHLSEELSDEEQDYFMIIFHAIIFRMKPKDMQSLYKCLFNLSKSFLNIFTKFLSNNEVLTFISQVAQTYYDANYVAERIIRPLFEWQPYISELGHTYAEYVKKIEMRKFKPLTIPVQPNVLSRKSKETPVPSTFSQYFPPNTPPNSTVIHKSKRMLSKSTIDERLKLIHEKNKQKAERLLNNVKNKNLHYAQTTKSDKYYARLSNIKNEIEISLGKNLLAAKKDHTPKRTPVVKETAATVKRLNKRIQMEEEEEEKWLRNVICYRNTAKIEEIAEHDREEKERERLLDIERKHLMGLITYEEAVISKKKLEEENRKKYEEFVKEKRSWNDEIERWKRNEIEKNRKLMEKQSLVELNILQAKNEIVQKKKENVEILKKESESRLEQVMLEKQKELERKIKMIKEIKILEIIARKAKVPKLVDLTDTAKLGLLCEMSIAELQERLSAMKIELKDELDSKRKVINEEKQAAKLELEETKNNIKKYMEERAEIRKYNMKLNNKITIQSHQSNNTSPSKNINYLKKVLEEKRTVRMKLKDPLPLC